jgi:hypothetical protein
MPSGEKGGWMWVLWFSDRGHWKHVCGGSGCCCCCNWGKAAAPAAASPRPPPLPSSPRSQGLAACVAAARRRSVAGAWLLARRVKPCSAARGDQVERGSLVRVYVRGRTTSMREQGPGRQQVDHLLASVCACVCVGEARWRVQRRWDPQGAQTA